MMSMSSVVVGRGSCRALRTLALAVIACGLISGCQNQAPSVIAGDDQTVAAGGTVTLDGSASFDLDGEMLTFQWTQTAGESVILDNADTAVATFIAPQEDAMLTFELEVNDAIASAAADVSVTVTTAFSRVLFIADIDGHNVIGYANPSTINGNVTPNLNIVGAETELNGPSDIVVNSSGQLLTTNYLGFSITAYDSALSARITLQPVGNVVGDSTGLLGPSAVTYDAARDLLYVANLLDARILVYADTAEPGFDGAVAPVRSIATTSTFAIKDPAGIFYGAGDDLYVANFGDSNVLVFAEASTLDGDDITPGRTIVSDAFESVVDVFVDDNDNLFVVDNDTASIYIFGNASTLDGEVTPDFTLIVPDAGNLKSMTVDSNDVGYIADNIANAVYSYDCISTQDGVVEPDRIISGPDTRMEFPWAVFIAE